MRAALRNQVLEAILYFCERDSVASRLTATELASKLLKKSTPYYLQASAVLFRSILYRLDGDMAKSEAQIRNFYKQDIPPKTRRDHALQGRLHISQIENKIKCYEPDVASFIYQWEVEQPMSTLDIEITSRVQSAAARLFQSIGDLEAAKAFLEQFLSLKRATPTPVNTRRVIISRLADIYCELREYPKVTEILQPELEGSTAPDRASRLYRRLMLALMEANVGFGRSDAAYRVLKKTQDIAFPEPDNLHDELLHMRTLFGAARIAHMGSDRAEAVLRWRFALQEVERMHILKSTRGFTSAIGYLSMAHAQLSIGDRHGARHSWLIGAAVLKSEICEFWIPVASTVWLREIATDVHKSEGWSLRIMLPGGRPDLTWP